MIITIVGGGNIGTQFAVHCAEKGHEVVVYTSTPEVFDDYNLTIIDESSSIIHKGIIKLATNDAEKAFKNTDMIIITVPATIMNKVAQLVYRYAPVESIIGVVPGNGGGECAFRQCIERGNPFFGIERVPAIARLVKKGTTVRSTGYREELHIAALPHYYADKCAEIIESIFGIRSTTIPNYLNLTMTPSNPILHTTRLRILFENWKKNMVYEQVPLFYEEWDNASSELLLACDQEVQNICQALPEFDLQYVESLRIHYESSTAEELTLKISSIPAFQGLIAPVIRSEGGYIPDLHSRYFTSDFSFGLTIIKQLAGFAEISTPFIDDTLDWYKSIAIETEEFSFADYGITDKVTLNSFYSL